MLFGSLTFAQRSYKYSWRINDGSTNDIKSHEETGDGDTVHGVYTVLHPDGCEQQVKYQADEDGYKPKITYKGNCNADIYFPHQSLSAIWKSGYVVNLPDGCVQTVQYEADENGYRPRITYSGNCNPALYIPISPQIPAQGQPSPNDPQGPTRNFNSPLQESIAKSETLPTNPSIKLQVPSIRPTSESSPKINPASSALLSEENTQNEAAETELIFKPTTPIRHKSNAVPVNEVQSFMNFGKSSSDSIDLARKESSAINAKDPQGRDEFLEESRVELSPGSSDTSFSSDKVKVAELIKTHDELELNRTVDELVFNDLVEDSKARNTIQDENPSLDRDTSTKEQKSNNKEAKSITILPILSKSANRTPETSKISSLSLEGQNQNLSPFPGPATKGLSQLTDQSQEMQLNDNDTSQILDTITKKLNDSLRSSPKTFSKVQQNSSQNTDDVNAPTLSDTALNSNIFHQSLTNLEPKLDDGRKRKEGNIFFQTSREPITSTSNEPLLLPEGSETLEPAKTPFPVSFKPTAHILSTNFFGTGIGNLPLEGEFSNNELSENPGIFATAEPVSRFIRMTDTETVEQVVSNRNFKGNEREVLAYQGKEQKTFPNETAAETNNIKASSLPKLGHLRHRFPTAATQENTQPNSSTIEKVAKTTDIREETKHLNAPPRTLNKGLGQIKRPYPIPYY
ncbi:uncharacterized protein LOC136041973 isoform X2 [Artemia franciscana]